MCNVPPNRIGLLDAMGFGNLGDAAIQDSVISNIHKRLPAAQFVGFSFVPHDTTKRHGIPCYPLTRQSQSDGSVTQRAGSRENNAPSLMARCKRIPVVRILARPAAALVRESVFLARSYSIIRNLDLLIMSGGGQLGDLWGGPWGHPYNLFKFSLLARLAGKQLYFLNVGAESLQHWLSRWFVRAAIGLAHYVSFRDTDSQTRMRSLGAGAKTHVYPDPAYALEVSKYVNGSPRKDSASTVGINPMGFCDPRIWPRKDQAVYDAYLEKLTNFSLWLLGQGYSLKLFPTSPGIDKYAIADLKRKVFERAACENPDPQPFHSLSERVKSTLCHSLAEALTEMSGCDLILTSKYHGVIFSQLLGKPVIALAYERKVEIAMRAAAQGQYCADVEHFETGWLIETFRAVVRDGEATRSQEANTVSTFADVLHKQFDELFSPNHNRASAS